jgi:ABC-type branched-subunit amino acid transport system substrate-binding protein
MDDGTDTPRPRRGRSRRRVLAAAGTALGAALAGCGGDSGEQTDADDPDVVDDTDTTTATDTPTATARPSTTAAQSGDDYPPLGNYPVEGDTVTYGFTVPLSGPFSTLGEHERRAYDLAVRHLNEGGGWADAWDDLSGDGVRGKSVEGVVRDTETDPGTARQAATRLIESDEAILLSGGVSTAVAIVTQQTCQQERVPYMAALSHSNVTTGAECVRYAFREMHNVEMGTRALVDFLVDDIGPSGTASVLYPDYSYGQSVQETTNRLFADRGWSTGETVAAPLGTADYSDYLDDIPRGSDVLVLSRFGPDALTAIRQAREMGVAAETTLVVPLLEGTLLDAAGPELDGVYGTVDWHWTRQDRYSTAFTDAYEAEYDERPPAAARLAYAATMRYSAAVERAGTYYPPEVVRAMEGHEYANTGIGQAVSRGCDHQSIRPVFVVEGNDPSAADAPVEIVAERGPDTVGYGCTRGPAGECELGDYQ